jgi:hypothetical protein
VEGAALDGLHRVLDGGVGGHEDDHGVGVGLLDATEQLQAVGVGEPEVEQDEVYARGRLFERHGAVRRLGDSIAFLLEAGTQRPPDEIFVVDDEHACRVHGAILDPVGVPRLRWPVRWAAVPGGVRGHRGEGVTEGIADGVRQVLEGERLGKDADNVSFPSLVLELGGDIRRHENHGAARAVAPQDVGERQPIQVRLVVTQEGHRSAGATPEGFPGVRRRLDPVAGFPQSRRGRPADELVVVHDEDGASVGGSALHGVVTSA